MHPQHSVQTQPYLYFYTKKMKQEIKKVQHYGATCNLF